MSANAAPGTATLLSPSDDARLETLRPALAGRADDPDGDPLDVTFEVAVDELFETVVASSPFVRALGGEGAWAPVEDLPPGAVHVRLRAADAEVLGPWSAPRRVVLEPRPIDDGPPPPPGGGPASRRRLIGGGCSHLGGSGGVALVSLSLGLFLSRPRRRGRARPEPSTHGSP